MQTKSITLLLGALLSTGLVLAQAPDQAQPSSAPQAAEQNRMQTHHAPDPGKQARHLGKKLGLTREQVTQIKPILEDRQQQLEGIRADNSLAQTDRRTKARDIMQESKNKIEAVLNDSQKQQFEQMLAERRARHSSQPQAQ